MIVRSVSMIRFNYPSVFSNNEIIINNYLGFDEIWMKLYSSQSRDTHVRRRNEIIKTIFTITGKCSRNITVHRFGFILYNNVVYVFKVKQYALSLYSLFKDNDDNKSK